MKLESSSPYPQEPATCLLTVYWCLIDVTMKWMRIRKFAESEYKLKYKWKYKWKRGPGWERRRIAPIPQSTTVTRRYVTATLTVKNSFPPPQNVFACFLQFSEDITIISLNAIKKVVFLMKAVFCEAGAESLKVN
jgi:hypothetical protein